MIFQIEAASTEDARKDATTSVQLLMDSITFAKGPSLQYHFRQITEMPRKEGGSQVVTTQVFISVDAYIVSKEGKEGIAPAFELTKRIPSHKKGEVLTRVFRWYARGTGDKVDKFVDYWVAFD